MIRSGIISLHRLLKRFSMSQTTKGLLSCRWLLQHPIFYSWLHFSKHGVLQYC